MTGHQKFSNLTKDLSSKRKAKIAIQTAELKEEMALAELRQALKNILRLIFLYNILNSTNIL
ncbi:hypothetical protein [Nodularia sp. LEGE 04288]|uniref:hypothetical protein n=1 Tax=Nodularia sp. LEGE 04288 TaxID=1828639 RepID=UPI001D11517F|nr:hypothetical protein [Nodularia sp. LEGE 04288]